MQESTLLKLVLAFSFFGVALLFFVSLGSSFSSGTDIQKIAEQEGLAVIEGEVLEARVSENSAFFVVAESREIEVIAFAGGLRIFPGEKVIVVGRIEEGQGKASMTAERIYKV